MSIKKEIDSYETANEPMPTKEKAYGFTVFVAATVIAINCAVPLGVFGIIFGNFLSTLGDETTATSLANGVLNTVLAFTGLATSVLLNKWSCRNVGLLGAVIYSIGSFSLLFVQDLFLFIVFFGVFQGFGFGLLLPASLTALNDFFTVKLSVIQSLSQAVMMACTMVSPPVATAAIKYCGYRETLLWIGVIGILNFPSAMVLISKRDQNNVPTENKQIGNSSNDTQKDWNNAEKPLLKKYNILKDVENAVSRELKFKQADTAPLTVSLDSNGVNEKSLPIGGKSAWTSVFASVDFSLLTDLKYLNIVVGLSLSFTSDVAFIAVIPVALSNVGFNSSDVALTMSIFFGSDLASRIMLSIFSAIRTPNSRHLVLWGSFLSAVFRIGFVWRTSFVWKTISLAALGFLRCFIQTPLPLVISQEYQDQFATAYSLYMVVCGVVALVVSLLMSVIKSLTNSDDLVCHVLTGCFVICVVSWVCEMTFNIRKKPEDEKGKNTSDV